MSQRVSLCLTGVRQTLREAPHLVSFCLIEGETLGEAPHSVSLRLTEGQGTGQVWYSDVKEHPARPNTWRRGTVKTRTRRHGDAETRNNVVPLL